MNDAKIRSLTEQFRKAIENARNAGCFDGDSFSDFPKGCCGDTCYLLAEFFRSKGLESIYVCGEDNTYQTHAWLIIKDERVNIPRPTFYDIPDSIRTVLNSYGGSVYSAPINFTQYTEDDVMNGLIIDITADQFGESPVYVGNICDFYCRRFEFQEASEYTDLGSGRLWNIYEKILQQLT